MKTSGKFETELYQDALSAARADHSTQAHRLLLEVVEREPQHVSAWLLLGKTASTQHAAEFYFQKALELDADPSVSEEDLEWAYSQVGYQTVQAIQLTNTKIQPFVRINPSPSTATVTRLLPRIRLGRYLLPLGFLLSLILFESLSTLTTPVAGMALYSLLLVALLLFAWVVDSRAQERFLLSMSLVPLIRVVSLVMPLTNIPPVFWYALIGVPLTLVAFLAVRRSGLTAAEIGLTANHLPLQLVIGLTGIVLGYAAFRIMGTNPVSLPQIQDQTWLISIITLMLIGFLVEIIFRGYMQHTSMEVLGLAGLYYVAAIYTIMFLGHQSPMYAVFIFVVSVLFGLIVSRTRSILGVSLAHGLMYIYLLLVFPRLF